MAVVRIVNMLACAVFSITTAVASFWVFPILLSIVNHLDIDDNGRLAYMQSQLMNVVEMCMESVATLSSDARILTANSFTEKLFGSKYIGNQLMDIVVPDDRMKLGIFFSAVLGDLNNDPRMIEYRIYGSAPDQDLWVESTVRKGNVRTIDDGVEVVELVMITRDVNQRKRANLLREMSDAIDEQQRLNESKLRFISCTAHDLKTPLQTFCIALDLLHNSQLNTAEKDLVSQASTAAELMKLTISQTIDIGKTINGVTIVPHKTSVSLTLLLCRIKVVINGYGKQVPIYYEASADLRDRIFSDEEWLWQMGLNLLTNACKYTAEGKITVRLSLDATDPLKDFLVFEVLDTGIGVPSDKHEHLFEAFNTLQVGQTIGTGLGLFGIQKKADSIGGACGVRDNTEAPTGSVFWFKVPYVLDTNELAVIETPLEEEDHGLSVKNEIASEVDNLVPETNTPNNKMTSTTSTEANDLIMSTATSVQQKQLTVLIIDDSASIRKLMHRAMQQLGFKKIVLCENGLKGLNALKAEQFDLVFCDVQMPIMSGPEVSSMLVQMLVLV